MVRMKCVISYDGSGFAGYQIQPAKRTVQSEIESALKVLHKGEAVKVTASGRTDAGVHARGQVIHFDTSLPIPETKWVQVLNSIFPEDIAAIQVEAVDDAFHARFSATGKEYRYRLYTTPHRDPLKRFYAYHFPYSLNIEAMEEAARYLTGTHDFTSFCSAKTEVKDKVRTIRKIAIVQEGEEIVFQLVGNGFLYNMVRIIVGTLLECGTGKRSPEEIPEILEAKDRSKAGKTVPPEGLYLWNVFYDN
ncbi:MULTISPECIES: tRNA pseudouridine(38-40) synthase TruA [Bacillus]|uniref:tRNA pseudouridine synthase A n=1 Tax=Bacillus smithii 7_3_47FAA TaxID=665952 RepID=G9QN62_9BACI|nr:tRNA pseudouridine(38-40) synthase TruA [Bacillus smithii]EHL76480.1 tRNA pseudouridine synthase A [Bacillus smithii 7_3_47FAA]